MAKIKSLDELPSVRDYLRRIGAEPRSMRTAVVKELAGAYWRDVAVIRLEKNGVVDAPEAYAPSEGEAKLIELEVLKADWPNHVKVKHPENLPDDVSRADPEDVFEFRDRQGMLSMLQVRKTLEDGGKIYVPWTYWDDGEWRRMEPEGPLPLWGMEHVGDHATVFIHEGAKAARAVHRMVHRGTAPDKAALAAHPWGAELQGAAHIGWIGGALSPHRTDWSALKEMGVRRAYIVSDNDQPGVAAVPAIAFNMRMTCFHVQFTSEWPVSFDLADEFPAHMFRELEGKRRYVGPPFRSCLHPATWATDLIANPRGKPTTVLRDNFKDAWAYVEEADIFVCVEMPEVMRSEAVLNRMLAPFSHASETSRLIVKAYRGRATKLCYRPDIPGRVVSDRTTSAINLHTPTMVRSEVGNPQPWLDFMEYMFPNPVERHQMMRWCATLIALPKVRMHYGVLLVSERQGIGKTTLGTNVLAPLVGLQNVGFPSEQTIVEGSFNAWMAHKRLLVVNEIYSGHSWKAYNRLKSLITDADIEVNQKYQRSYNIENWGHVLACSNSLRALKVEGDDRRWFYPEVTETPWTNAQFEAFRNWLESGGLGIIKTWAEGFGDYVRSGERAPMTSRKEELIDSSRSEGQQEAIDIAHALCAEREPAALTMKGVVFAVRAAVQGRMFDQDHELRKSMTEAGAKVLPKRYKVNGRAQHIIVNEAFWRAYSKMEESEGATFVRECIKQPADLMENSI
jgi:hypothetical protein